MKHFLIFLSLLITQQATAQKYILLDKQMYQAPEYVNTVTSNDKFNGFFPIEKKQIKEFIKTLEEISKMLSTPGFRGEAIQYEVGNVIFIGHAVDVMNEHRFDYVIFTNLNDQKFSMHLCNAKFRNATNAYFLNTWVKYIKNSLR